CDLRHLAVSPARHRHQHAYPGHGRHRRVPGLAVRGVNTRVSTKGTPRRISSEFGSVPDGQASYRQPLGPFTRLISPMARKTNNDGNKGRNSKKKQPKQPLAARNGTDPSAQDSEYLNLRKRVDSRKDAKQILKIAERIEKESDE